MHFQEVVALMEPSVIGFYSEFWFGEKDQKIRLQATRLAGENR